MLHPAHAAHALQQQLEVITRLCKDQTISEEIKKAESLLQTLRFDMASREDQRSNDQQIFCDSLTIEFSTKPDFSNAYIRAYENMCVDMETLKTIVYGERSLQNMSDELLFARIVILDNDPEA